jgi:photosystem II stability/assembly factor-like uncharacterized protein
MGLRDSREIGAVVINPSNCGVVFIAALGHLWGRNTERGIFKTTDGGITWEKVLYVNDSTGFIDVKMDPHDPNVLYAASWQRFRYGDGDMDESGPGSAIYKTSDAGQTWRKLTNGIPTEDLGKIGLAVAYHNSNIVYAAILSGEPLGQGKRTSPAGGVFRSIDGGESWQRVNSMQSSYYYSHIYVDPSDDNRVVMPVYQLYVSTDGGSTFIKNNMKNVHNDLHSIWIDPRDSAHLVLSGDGGVNISFDRGATWIYQMIPVGQFYEVSTDNQDPYFIYGGMQDTDHWSGPSRTYDHEGITNHDWIKLRINGDGMAVRADPVDPNRVYMVEIFGRLSLLNLRKWERFEMQPAPEEASKKGLSPFRYDWSTPMIISKHDPSVLYLGSQYLFRYTQHGMHFDVISGDQSRQQASKPRSSRDGYHSYGALFSISESPLDPAVIWTGADDGPIHVTRDGGKSWADVTANFPSGAPSWATALIEASHFNKATAYAVYDNHTREDTRPYLFKTTDFGKKWVDITGDLPMSATAYVLREDPVNPNLLFVGTEVGVFVSIEGGWHWTRWANNLPTVAVVAMEIQGREKELVVGTFGRAIWVADIGPLEEMTTDILGRAAYIFDIKPATLFRYRYTYGGIEEELNGDQFFRAENPPYGAMLTYYLPDSLRNDQGQVTITIEDAAGQVVRTLDGLSTAGIHRVNWDLNKQNLPTDEDYRKARVEPEDEVDFMARVQAGTYKVTLHVSGVTLSKNAIVIPENDGVKRVLVRK